MKDIVTFVYKNRMGGVKEHTGIIVKSSLADGKFIVKCAPELSFKGEVLPPAELVLSLDGIRPQDRLAFTQAAAAFEAAKIAAKPAAAVAVEPTPAVLKKLEAARKAFLGR